MTIFSSSAIRIQPYFGYRNSTRLVLTARALRSGKPNFKRSGRLQAFRTMLAQFASREVEGLPVTLEIAAPGTGKPAHYECITDEEGFVRFDIPLDNGGGNSWPMPKHTSWEVVALHWRGDSSPSAEELWVEGHVLAPAAGADLGVISDIDDTIIETGITGNFRAIMRNWRRVVAQLPEDRIAVPGADTFYNALGGGAVLHENEAHPGERMPATYRPFFYISSSPWNLFSYLVSFQKSRKLPLGPLMLRDWGFDRETLGSAGHGQHKREAIEEILAAYPKMRFSLIGDDTQGDLTAYGAIVSDHPRRIAAIVIRTAGEAMLPEELAAREMIEASGVPLWLGDSYDVGQEFLNASGLSADGGASRIIEVVEHAPGEV